MDGRRKDEQLSLDLGPPPRDCLFFAVVPPAAVAAHIVERAQRWRHRHGVRSRPRPPGLLHISMNGIGIYRGLPKKVVHAAVEAGSQVEMAPFEVTFDHAMGFKNRSRSPFVLCARVDPSGLLELRSAIGTAMHSVGFRDTGRARFKPHVTMMYTDQMMCEACVDEPIRWTVHDFVLVHSLQGRGRHVYCGRWPLHR
jgi:2'-5' RNA ligase